MGDTEGKENLPGKYSCIGSGRREADSRVLCGGDRSSISKVGSFVFDTFELK